MRTIPAPGTLFGAAALVVSVAFSSLPAAVAGTAADAASAVGIVDADTVRGKRPIAPDSKAIGTRRARGRLLVLNANGRIPKRALPKGTEGAVPDIVVRSYEAQGSSTTRATATAWCLNGERLIGAAGYGRDPYNAQPMPLAPYFTLTGNPATTGTVNPDGFTVVSQAPPGQSVVAQALCASVRP
jgi:hypothetical protein